MHEFGLRLVRTIVVFKRCFYRNVEFKICKKQNRLPGNGGHLLIRFIFMFSSRWMDSLLVLESALARQRFHQI
jgi:hypothetical protein